MRLIRQALLNLDHTIQKRCLGCVSWSCQKIKTKWLGRHFINLFSAMNFFSESIPSFLALQRSELGNKIYLPWIDLFLEIFEAKETVRWWCAKRELKIKLVLISERLFWKGGVGEGKRSLLDRGAGRLLSKKKKRNVFIIMCVYLPIK